MRLNKDEIDDLNKLYEDRKLYVVKCAILLPFISLFVSFIPLSLFRKVPNVNVSANNLYEYFGFQKWFIIFSISSIIIYLLLLIESNIYNLKKDSKSLTKICKTDEVVDYHEHKEGRSITLKGSNPKVISFSPENYIKLYKKDFIEFEVYTNSKELIRVKIVDNIL